MIPKLFRSKIWHSRTFFVLLHSISAGDWVLVPPAPLWIMEDFLILKREGREVKSLPGISPQIFTLGKPRFCGLVF